MNRIQRNFTPLRYMHSSIRMYYGNGPSRRVAEIYRCSRRLVRVDLWTIPGSKRYLPPSHPAYEYHEDCSKKWDPDFCESLAQIFMDSPVGTSITMSVYLHQDDKMIKVSVEDGGNIIFTNELKNGEDYECDQHRVVITPEAEGGDADIAYAVGISNKYSFRPGEDGSLIMDETESGVLLSLVIPPFILPVKSTTWYRWLAIIP